MVGTIGLGGVLMIGTVVQLLELTEVDRPRGSFVAHAYYCTCQTPRQCPFIRVSRSSLNPRPSCGRHGPFRDAKADIYRHKGREYRVNIPVPLPNENVR
ncbi:MAG: hypothetical protein JWP06_804 [Candidatus Saccharibacteria bacterium]|nr:hypothetical protein [Candidatus Saccharibacteria bacterium]